MPHPLLPQPHLLLQRTCTASAASCASSRWTQRQAFLRLGEASQSSCRVQGGWAGAAATCQHPSRAPRASHLLWSAPDAGVLYKGHRAPDQEQGPRRPQAPAGGRPGPRRQGRAWHGSPALRPPPTQHHLLRCLHNTVDVASLPPPHQVLMSSIAMRRTKDMQVPLGPPLGPPLPLLWVPWEAALLSCVWHVAI